MKTDDSYEDCKCMDCGGAEPTHSSGCKYMNELIGPFDSIFCATCGYEFIVSPNA